MVFKDKVTGLLVCGGRNQVFAEDKSEVPLMSYGAWISMLIAREAHNVNHDSVAGTLLRMRKKDWVIQGRRLAKKIIDSCVTYRKIKAKHCRQVMSEWTPERVSPSNPFELTSVDLFRPYEVKDEVNKKEDEKLWRWRGVHQSQFAVARLNQPKRRSRGLPVWVLFLQKALNHSAFGQEILEEVEWASWSKLNCQK